MIRNFDDAFAVMMGHEGGYSDHPADPGGKTMYGVTEAVARAHGYRGAMQALPKELARKIAKAEYWDAVRGDELDPELAYQLMDFAFNSGPERAIACLQRALGVGDDGEFGPVTMKAVLAKPAPVVIGRLAGQRLLFLANLGTWGSFGKGWARRVAANLLRL